MTLLNTYLDQIRDSDGNLLLYSQFKALLGLLCLTLSMEMFSSVFLSRTLLYKPYNVADFLTLTMVSVILLKESIVELLKKINIDALLEELQLILEYEHSLTPPPKIEQVKAWLGEDPETLTLPMSIEPPLKPQSYGLDGSPFTENEFPELQSMNLTQMEAAGSSTQLLLAAPEETEPIFTYMEESANPEQPEPIFDPTPYIRHQPVNPYEPPKTPSLSRGFQKGPTEPRTAWGLSIEPL